MLFESAATVIFSTLSFERLSINTAHERIVLNFFLLPESAGSQEYFVSFVFNKQFTNQFSSTLDRLLGKKKSLFHIMIVVVFYLFKASNIISRIICSFWRTAIGRFDFRAKNPDNELNLPCLVLREYLGTSCSCCYLGTLI